MNVLGLGEDNVLPRRNSEDPGSSVPVYGDNRINSTIDVVRLSIGLKCLVMDHEAPQCIAEEYDLVRLEDDGHDSWHSLIRGLVGGFHGGKSKAVKVA